MSIQTLGSLDDSYFEIDGLSTWFCFGWVVGFRWGVSWFGVGFIFLYKTHVFDFVLSLQQVINVHLTGAAVVNINCICVVKTVLSVIVFICYLYQWVTLYCVLRPYVGTPEL